MSAVDQYLDDANGWPGLAALAALLNHDEKSAVVLLGQLDTAEAHLLVPAAEALAELAHKRTCT